MSDEKTLCLGLAKAETEEEVIDILKKNGYWDEKSAWRFYGDFENNWATIGNQQSKPEAALVEKIINSVDHILIKECKLHSIEPESSDAPQSISEAVEKFFGVKNGVLSYMHSSERSKLGENIILVSTGKKTNPCFSVIDKGEGQSPQKMPDTFLSLARSNKLRIPFVQGKFNMGGTGSFRFCGRHNIQLIISKRNPQIAANEKNDQTTDKWGFTVVRREEPTGGRRSSVYKYLAPSGKILCFSSKTLPLIPEKYPEKMGKEIEFGSFIKLYEYNIIGLKTNILFDLYNRMSILLPSVALPVRFYERREGYTGHSFETTMSGLSVRLDDDKRENLEQGFPSSFEISAMKQKMNCSLFAFKKGSAEKYRKDEGIIFVVNGQTHGYIGTNFFSKKSVGMSYLSDSLLVTIDCSKFDGRAREDIFLNSRDRLSDCDLKFEIENRLEELLSHHQGLRDLRERRRREEIQNKLEDSKPLSEVLNEVLKKSPALAALLKFGSKIQNPFNLTETGEKEEFVGKRFPTYFDLKPKPKNKVTPINRRFRIFYETDANNDYFERAEYPGRFVLESNGIKIEDYTLNLWNGVATLTVALPQGCKIGDKIKFNSTATDDTQINPFIEEFELTVGKEQEEVKGEPGERRKPPSGKGKGREATSGLSLPKIIEVYKNEWENHKFDEESALRVVNAGENEYDFYLNMDNIYLLSEIKSNSSIEPKLMQAKYKYALVLIGLALLKEENETSDEMSATDKIAKTTRLLSPIILPMISYLGELEID